ncbi:MAG: hypothetical protein NTX85_00875 [Candidatus Nomurabacteria bacterium]|nr:hypothetical protein [Candidatus Nomurabacteria bacterium]
MNEELNKKEDQGSTVPGQEKKKFSAIIAKDEYVLKEETRPMTQEEIDEKNIRNQAQITKVQEEIKDKLSETNAQTEEKKFSAIPGDKEFFLKEEVQKKEKGIKGFFKNLLK